LAEDGGGEFSSHEANGGDKIRAHTKELQKKHWKKDALIAIKNPKCDFLLVWIAFPVLKKILSE